jgi:hypothetical protein
MPSNTHAPALAQRGFGAKTATHDSLNAAYRQFMSEADTERKIAAGKSLIRAVFGKAAIVDQ